METDKLIIDCNTDNIIHTNFTQDELTRVNEIVTEIEEILVNKMLEPTEEEILKAEMDLNTITLLSELGLI